MQSKIEPAINDRGTQSIIKGSKIEEGYIVWSKYFNLPNKRILFYAQDHEQKTTTLKIYSTDDLNTSIIKNIMEGDFRFLCIAPNGTILLRDQSEFFKQKLVKICPKTLSVISTQPWKYNRYAGVIDNERFFVIRKADDSFKNKKLERCLLVYKWDENSYVNTNKIQLSAHPNTAGGDMSDIRSLGNNRYCCIMRGHNTDEFRVLLFDFDSKNNEVNELGIIQPIVQVHGCSSSASGELEVLPNGQLLTYHDCDDNVQIWDPQTRRCVKEWNWADVQKPDNFQLLCLKIMPLADSIHLLVSQGEGFFLFNTDTLELKKIELEGHPKLEYHGNHHILANGQVLATIVDRAITKDWIRVLHFDLPEMVFYRKQIGVNKQSQCVSSRFFTPVSPNEQTEPNLSSTVTILAKTPSDDDNRSRPV